MNDIKLKPCPFCGGEAEIVRYCDGPVIHFFVSCKDCYATGGYRVTKEGAAESWNKRAETEAHLYTLDELIQLKSLTAVYLEECDDPESECHVTEWIGSLRVKADNYAHVEPYTQMLFKNYSEASEEYGSYWRCWSSRPTEAQMRATQWQGVSK